MDPNIPPQPTQPVTTETLVPPANNPRSPSKTKYILIVIILLALAIIGMGIYYLGIVNKRVSEQKVNITPIVTKIPTPTPLPIYQPSDLYQVKVSTKSGGLVPRLWLDLYLDRTFSSTSAKINRISYDTRNGYPYYPNDDYNFTYYVLLSKGKLDISKTYGDNNVNIKVSHADPKLLPYISDPESKYCMTDSDCRIGYSFCSYGGFNHYSVYKSVWGCGPPSDIDSPNGEETFQLYDEKLQCSPDVIYKSVKCIKSKCIGQDRQVICSK